MNNAIQRDEGLNNSPLDLQDDGERLAGDLCGRIIFPMTCYSLDNFFCRIWYNLVQKPKHCNSCGKVFCKHCLEKWLRLKKICPYKWTSKEFKNPNGFYLSTYKGIRIKCKYEQYGCTKKLKQGSLKTHQSNCKYKPVKCAHCKEMVPMINLSQHYDEWESFPIECESWAFHI